MTLNLEYEWFKFGNPYWIMIILIDLSSLPAKHSLKLIDRDYLQEIISSEYLNFETIQRNHSSSLIFLNKNGGVFFKNLEFLWIWVEVKPSSVRNFGLDWGQIRLIWGCKAICVSDCQNRSETVLNIKQIFEVIKSMGITETVQ